MFLPNTYSFVLTRGTIVDPSFTPLEVAAPRSSGLATLSRARLLTGFTPEARRGVFLPNTDSFLLRRRPIVDPIFTPGSENVVATVPQSTDSEQPKINDRNKRAFVKALGFAGAGIAAATLLPNKAQALIMGSSPTTGVVGVKNATNTRINPATQETVATLLKTSDLTFAAGDLQVKVTSLPAGGSSFSDSAGVAKSGLVNASRNVQVDVLSSTLPSSASTETTLQTISFGGFKFTLRLDTVGTIDYVGEATIGTATSAALWRIKRLDNTTGTVIQWAGTGVFNQIWDNRTSLTYS